MRQLHHRDAETAITFSQMAAKRYYDGKHHPSHFQVSDKVLLNLHRGYQLPGGGGHKFTQQRVGPFKILEKIGPLAYRLRLPPRWSIHPVISVAHLSLMPKGNDPFSRKYPNHPEII